MYEVFEFIVIAGLMYVLASSLLSAIKVICEDENEAQPAPKPAARSNYQRKIDFEYSREINRRILKDDAA